MPLALLDELTIVSSFQLSLLCAQDTDTYGSVVSGNEPIALLKVLTQRDRLYKPRKPSTHFTHELVLPPSTSHAVETLPTTIYKALRVSDKDRNESSFADV